MPTSICANGPAPPSVTSTGRLRVRMRDTISADAANVTALTTNTQPGELSASSAAPIAGPVTLVRLSIVPSSALAAASSSSRATCGSIAATAG